MPLNKIFANAYFTVVRFLLLKKFTFYQYYVNLNH